MIRIACIGNSHLACLKLAWDQIAPQHPGAFCEFIGIPGKLSETFRVVDGYVGSDSERARKFTVSASSEGERLFLFDKDAVIVCGLGWNTVLLINALLDHRSLSFESHTTARYLASDDCLVQALADCVAESKAFRLAADIHRTFPGTVHVVPTPLPTKDILTHGPIRSRRILRTFLDAGDDKVFAELCATVADRLSTSQIKLHLQPADTVEDRLFTAERFSRGAKRLLEDLDAEHGEENYNHMNAEFGCHVMRELLTEILAEAPAGQTS